MRRAFWSVAVLPWVFWAVLSGQNSPSPIHFTYKPIDFKLDSSETPQRHAPETMAGGVAVFDYNNDGYLDIYFTNGADIATLKKSSPKYSNRLFENDGHGNFKDVTEKAGLAGSGFDNGVAIGDYDNDGYKDIFVGGVHGNRLYHNNGNGTFTDVTAKAGLNQPDKQYGPLWSVGGAWLDVNNDGLLDLFVVDYLAWDYQDRTRLRSRSRQARLLSSEILQRDPESVIPQPGRRNLQGYLGGIWNPRPSGQGHGCRNRGL